MEKRCILSFSSTEELIIWHLELMGDDPMTRYPCGIFAFGGDII